MTILILGDLHDHDRRLRAALALVSGRPLDLVLQAGDVGRDPPWRDLPPPVPREGHDRSVRCMLQTIRDATSAPLVFVPGNHDLPDPPETLPGMNADGRVVEVAGLRIAGLGGAGPGRFGFPYEWGEREADVRLRGMLDGPGRVDILLSHTPPAASSLDRTAGGEHVGSRSVSRWIERARPRLFVCGHIHEAWGHETLHGVTCVNAGSLGEPYGRVIAWIVGWDGGPTHVEALRGPDPG